MADEPKGETPIQRALRLKKAALEVRQGPGGRTRNDADRAAAARSSAKSKPWMKK
ncbi:MAG: hypothetical protein ACJ8CH_23460 [Microvirga sp.]